jgi:hypothetical protein
MASGSWEVGFTAREALNTTSRVIDATYAELRELLPTQVWQYRFPVVRASPGSVSSTVSLAAFAVQEELEA